MTGVAPSSALEAAVATALREHGDVQVAYLFGSEARGSAGPLSDVDVAVLLAGTPAPRRRLQLLADVQAVVGRRRADLVLLNDAPPAVAYRVVTEGRPVLVRDDVERVRHAAAAMDRWLDLAPLRRELADGQHHRLVEGRFGRR